MGIASGIGVAAFGTPPAGDLADLVVAGTLTAIGASPPALLAGPFNVNVWPSVVTTLTATNGSLAVTLASATGLAVGNAVDSVLLPAGATIATLAGLNATLTLPPVFLNGSYQANFPQIGGLERTAGLVGAVVTGPGIPNGAFVVAIVKPADTSGAVFPTGGGIAQISAAPTAAASNAALQFQSAGGEIVTGDDAAARFTGGAMTFDATWQLEKSYDGGATWLVAGVGGAGQQAIYAGNTNVSFPVAGEAENGVLWRVDVTAYISGTVNYRLSQNTAMGSRFRPAA